MKVSYDQITPPAHLGRHQIKKSTIWYASAYEVGGRESNPRIKKVLPKMHPKLVTWYWKSHKFLHGRCGMYGKLHTWDSEKLCFLVLIKTFKNSVRGEWVSEWVTGWRNLRKWKSIFVGSSSLAQNIMCLYRRQFFAVYIRWMAHSRAKMYSFTDNVTYSPNMEESCT